MIGKTQIFHHIKKKKLKIWKKNNKSIALNFLYVPHSIKEREYNLEHKNQVILLIITDDDKCHFLAVKGLSALLRAITSKHKEDFYCLNCFHSYITKNKLEKHQKL